MGVWLDPREDIPSLALRDFIYSRFSLATKINSFKFG
jgi:hypothetical protein